MNVLYADTSALIRAYLPDEPDHAALRAQILNRSTVTITSELARVEIASAATAAQRSGRIRSAARLLARMDATFAADGPITLIRLTSATILPRACRIVLDHHVRTLDAIHLAVAAHDGAAIAADADLIFLTCDAAQATATRALGMTVA